MGIITDLLKNVDIPNMTPIRQRFDDTHIPTADIPRMVETQLSRPEIANSLRPGMEIAITVGSRGISNIALITRSIVDFLKQHQVTPFIVPAMGSHGGATAEGQRQVIASYGITEASMGCEIRSSMETVEIAKTASGQPVHIDKNAFHSDGIIVCGRVKPHTGFRGPYESGIMKMMAIGLGKQFGAEIIHKDGFGHFREYIPLYGNAILKTASILCGLALLENAYDQTREIVSLTPTEIIELEPILLQRAKSYMPRILFDHCDVLIVDEMGKNISGDGMDPNISGRFPSPFAEGGINAQRVVVLDLTAESHGNACGIGLADCTTRRLFNKMDLEQTYPNAITNTVTDEMKIPMIMENDKLAIQLGLKTCVENDKARPRVIRIKNTLSMEIIEISDALLEEAALHPNIEILASAKPMPFNSQDNLF